MDESEFMECCYTCLNWINFERISKNKSSLYISMPDDNENTYELCGEGFTILSSTNVKNFFYKLLGIARYLQFENNT